MNKIQYTHSRELISMRHSDLVIDSNEGRVVLVVQNTENGAKRPISVLNNPVHAGIFR
ncbi:hypothetical protein [Nitrosomonas communis]|uniref:hypothetical protein n=1 Tax=Nitrosomonas communis TaxID=44574 RepID=UPI0026EAF85E|nr:hypothetical protein [Nitrosomonas communis]MCO6428242.1 hypothetical protein [Nitrosomonas communis]